MIIASCSRSQWCSNTPHLGNTQALLLAWKLNCMCLYCHLGNETFQYWMGAMLRSRRKTSKFKWFTMSASVKITWLNKCLFFPCTVILILGLISNHLVVIVTELSWDRGESFVYIFTLAQFCTIIRSLVIGMRKNSDKSKVLLIVYILWHPNNGKILLNDYIFCRTNDMGNRLLPNFNTKSIIISQTMLPIWPKNCQLTMTNQIYLWQRKRLFHNQ